MHISHMRKIIFDVQALGGGGVGDGVPVHVMTRNYIIIIVIIESAGCAFSSAAAHMILYNTTERRSSTKRAVFE